MMTVALPGEKMTRVLSRRPPEVSLENDPTVTACGSERGETASPKTLFPPFLLLFLHLLPLSLLLPPAAFGLHNANMTRFSLLSPSPSLGKRVELTETATTWKDRAGIPMKGKRRNERKSSSEAQVSTKRRKKRERRDKKGRYLSSSFSFSPSLRVRASSYPVINGQRKRRDEPHGQSLVFVARDVRCVPHPDGRGGQ
jgi:hypothetical protein